jgi:hypothetical protein
MHQTEKADGFIHFWHSKLEIEKVIKSNLIKGGTIYDFL